jgi:hypothetical protein
MVHAGLSRIKWCVTGAVVVALTSLAYAKPPFASHEGHGFFGGGANMHGSSYGGAVRGDAGPRTVAAHVANAHAAHYAQNGTQRMRVNAPSRTSGKPADANRIYTGNASGYSAQRLGLPFDDAYRGRPSAQYVGTQYAGAITPVSTDSRAAPRPPANAQAAHVGSIRDDVTRYNEERGASRQIPRPPSDSRIPAPSPYRN